MVDRPDSTAVRYWTMRRKHSRGSRVLSTGILLLRAASRGLFVAQDQDVAALGAFLDGRAARPTGLVYGRRRIGKSTCSSGREWELDLVVTDEHPDPAHRRITAIGEARAGTRIGRRHLGRLVEARDQLGPRAVEAQLLVIGSSFDEGLLVEAAGRDDVEIVDLDRLCHGHRSSGRMVGSAWRGCPQAGSAIDRVPSGGFRARLMSDGQTDTLTFPTECEAVGWLAVARGTCCCSAWNSETHGGPRLDDAFGCLGEFIDVAAMVGCHRRDVAVHAYEPEPRLLQRGSGVIRTLVVLAVGEPSLRPHATASGAQVEAFCAERTTTGTSKRPPQLRWRRSPRPRLAWGRAGCSGTGRCRAR